MSTEPPPEIVEAPSGETAELPDRLPVLPTKGLVVFPQSVTPLLVGEERSVRLIDDDSWRLSNLNAPADVERFLRDHLLQSPHVQEAHSNIAMSVVKRTTELPLD